MMDSIAPKSNVLKNIIESAGKNVNKKAKRLMGPRMKPPHIQTNERAGNPRLKLLSRSKNALGKKPPSMGGSNFSPNQDPNASDQDQDEL
jgi:hypothetical protein